MQIQNYIHVSANIVKNIFDKQQIEQAGIIDCKVCRQFECLKCKDYHSSIFTCEEWKDRNKLRKDQLDKLGIKQCLKCKIGIQKNQGCKQLECKNCKFHLCWICLRVFETSQLCYDHIAKQCGGIMEDNIRQ